MTSLSALASAPFRLAHRLTLLWWVLALGPFFLLRSSAATPAASVLVSVEGSVEFMAGGAKEWVSGKAGDSFEPPYRLRTGPKSRALVRLATMSVLRVGELMEYQILPPAPARPRPLLDIITGFGYFFGREKSELDISTPVVTGGIRGTEFDIKVGPDGATTVAIIDGVVDLTNRFGGVTLTNQELAEVTRQEAPRKTGLINATRVVQWTLYYPAVLDPEEVKQTSEALQIYRTGDVLGAVRALRGTASAGSETPSAVAFRAALFLAAGDVRGAEELLKGFDDLRQANAIRTLIASVRGEELTGAEKAASASEWLAHSYYLQSRGDLTGARNAAQEALKISPAFAFALTRLAELEFSFGRNKEASALLDKALRLAPRNARAFSLRGFLAAGENRTVSAIEFFNQAIAIDPSFGEPWLGRGLAKVRRTQVEEALGDIQAAAALEPTRAIFRSYLGKTFAELGQFPRATHELDLARRFDAKDPTARLYSALIAQQENRINDAIRELEEASQMNTNRAVYRSRLLLDQDAAVKGVNLAGIYRDAGMDVVSFREASRAVNFDYASASAHLFLANSYNQLRDPNQINLRYETAWLSEYLTGHLLAPPGAGPLSQMVSAQEYSRLFDRDGLGFATRTEYLSRGAWRQESSQYGHFGGLDYAVDSLYLSDPGQRRNNDQEQFTISFNAKQQLTRADSIYVQAISYDAHAGDLAQYYDPASSQATLRTRESQHPQLLLGYHHEWQPGSHTLVLAGRLEDTLRASDDFQSVLLLGRGPNNEVIAVPSATLPTAALAYRSGLELYSAEVAQIWQHEEHTLVVDGRYQAGWFDTSSQLGASTGTTLSDTTQTTPVAFAAPANSQMAETSLERFATSGYYFWNIVPALQFVGGVAYDLLRFPMNYRNAPISGGSDSRSQFSPKFGATWNVRTGTTARFAYTRSLGGASFDQSVRLEPSQIAGFNQSFRSIIPESVVGSTTGARFETFGLGLDQRFARKTYLTLEGQILRSDVSRSLGAVDVNFPAGFTPSQIRQRLDFEERSVALTLNHLVGESWAFGMRYQLADAVLATRFPEISSSVSTASDVETGAILHETDLFAIFNHRSGFYFRGDAKWWLQDNRGYNPGLPGEDLWQFDLLAGYRFWHRKGQVQIGLLNLTDRDYRLNPLTIHPDLPRARTLTASVQFTY